MFVAQVYCTLIPPALGVRGQRPRETGVRGEAPKKKFWDMCWPTVMQTHGIGLTIVFSHGISPIKEKHCNTDVYGIVLYCKQSL